MKKVQAIVSFSFTKRIIFANKKESSAFLLAATNAAAICRASGGILYAKGNGDEFININESCC